MLCYWRICLLVCLVLCLLIWICSCWWRFCLCMWWCCCLGCVGRCFVVCLVDVLGWDCWVVWLLGCSVWFWGVVVVWWWWMVWWNCGFFCWFWLFVFLGFCYSWWFVVCWEWMFWVLLWFCRWGSCVGRLIFVYWYWWFYGLLECSSVVNLVVFGYCWKVVFYGRILYWRICCWWSFFLVIIVYVRLVGWFVYRLCYVGNGCLCGVIRWLCCCGVGVFVWNWSWCLFWYSCWWCFCCGFFWCGDCCCSWVRWWKCCCFSLLDWYRFLKNLGLGNSWVLRYRLIVWWYWVWFGFLVYSVWVGCSVNFWVEDCELRNGFGYVCFFLGWCLFVLVGFGCSRRLCFFVLVGGVVWFFWCYVIGCWVVGWGDSGLVWWCCCVWNVMYWLSVCLVLGLVFVCWRWFVVMVCLIYWLVM